MDEEYAKGKHYVVFLFLHTKHTSIKLARLNYDLLRQMQLLVPSYYYAIWRRNNNYPSIGPNQLALIDVSSLSPKTRPHPTTPCTGRSSLPRSNPTEMSTSSKSSSSYSAEQVCRSV